MTKTFTKDDSKIEKRFWSRVTKTPTCWLFTGSCDNKGYGNFWDGEKSQKAHRYAYTLLVGPIPEGLQLDHVYANGCTNKNCVKPEHLEPVTLQVNHARRVALITHCPKGHEYTESNTYITKLGGRNCRTCYGLTGLGHQPKSTCVYGHSLDFENLYVRPSGLGRECKICRRNAVQKSRNKDKEHHNG